MNEFNETTRARSSGFVESQRYMRPYYFPPWLIILFLLNKREMNNMQEKQNMFYERNWDVADRYYIFKWMLEDMKLLNVRQTIFIKSMWILYKIGHELFSKHLMEEINLTNIYIFY